MSNWVISGFSPDPGNIQLVPVLWMFTNNTVLYTDLSIRDLQRGPFTNGSMLLRQFKQSILNPLINYE